MPNVDRVTVASGKPDAEATMYRAELVGRDVALYMEECALVRAEADAVSEKRAGRVADQLAEVRERRADVAASLGALG